MERITYNPLSSRLSNELIEEAISELLSANSIYAEGETLVHFGALIGLITDSELLERTISKAQFAGFLLNINDISEKIQQLSAIYSPAEFLWLKAKVISLNFAYQHLEIFDKHIPSHGYALPNLKIHFGNVFVEHNLNEIANLIQRRTIVTETQRFGDAPENVQKIYLSALIDAMRKSDYLNNSESFRDDIKFLKAVSKTVAFPVIASANENPFPRIFVGMDNKAFRLFSAYVSKHVLDGNDVSFIVHQMWKDKLIINIRIWN